MRALVTYGSSRGGTKGLAGMIAEDRPIPPVKGVAGLMEVVGARDHATFGGRLESSARGFLASQMAKTRSGDWRDKDHVFAWVNSVVASQKN